MSLDAHTPHGLCYNTLTMPSRFFRVRLLILCAAIGAGTCPAAHGQSQGTLRTSPPAETHPETLLIFPFENDGRIASLDWLGEGLVELSAERLQSRSLNVLSRQERLAAIEKIGLPTSAQFTRATMVKIAAEADADAIIFGRFVSDGNTVTLEAHVMRMSPPWLSPSYMQSGPMRDLLRAHAHLSWQLLCALDRRDCTEEASKKDESVFTDPPPMLRLDALESFVNGVLASDDEPRTRALREAARLEPAWDRPPFELGQAYFADRDCESALPWFSRVPPNRPDGPEASFNTGVCHLLRHDDTRAEAAFSGLIERSRSADPDVHLPELSEARNNLGVALLRLGKWNEAATEFERAASLDAEDPDYWVNLAIAKLAAGQADAALAPLERARKLDPDDKDARSLLISVLESLGRGAEAAPIRSEVISGEGGRAVPPIPRDPAGLGRLTRVKMRFDRILLHPQGDPSDLDTSHPERSPGLVGRENQR